MNINNSIENYYSNMYACIHGWASNEHRDDYIVQVQVNSQLLYLFKKSPNHQEYQKISLSKIIDLIENSYKNQFLPRHKIKIIAERLKIITEKMSKRENRTSIGKIVQRAKNIYSILQYGLDRSWKKVLQYRKEKQEWPSAKNRALILLEEMRKTQG